MRGKICITLIILGIFLQTLFLFPSHCEQQQDEYIEKLLLKTESIINEPQVLEEVLSGTDKGENVVSQYNELTKNIKQFIADYPDNRYSDDASYISTQFFLSKPEKYIQELKLFIYSYPEASLEDWCKKNLGRLMVIPAEVGLLNSARFDLSLSLFHSNKYEESIKTIRAFIDNVDINTLNEKGIRTFALGYYYLMKNYESLNNKLKVKETCEEAIKNLPTDSQKSFIDKLKELNI